MIKKIVVTYETSEGQTEGELLDDVSASVNIGKYRLAFHEIIDRFRSVLKYQELTENEYGLIANLRDEFIDLTADLREL